MMRFLAQTASQSVQQRLIESGEYCRINNGIYEQCKTITLYFTVIYNVLRSPSRHGRKEGGLNAPCVTAPTEDSLNGLRMISANRT